jgi:hypothetical protein
MEGLFNVCLMIKKLLFNYYFIINLIKIIYSQLYF